MITPFWRLVLATGAVLVPITNLLKGEARPSTPQRPSHSPVAGSSHSSSSLPSSHSGLPEQREVPGTHCPLLHLNWWSLQPLWQCSPSSSLPSGQSRSPSHSQA